MARIEKDFLGEREIPDDAYYGVQTLRGKENFHITGISMSAEPYFVKAFGYAKKAAALANRDLGVLDASAGRTGGAGEHHMLHLRPEDLRHCRDGFIRHGAKEKHQGPAIEVLAKR